ncbi:MAG: protein jag [Actinomycetota bacterium]|jgi:spoIIIJ-associated protein|nr:protein jag [Actinomycetota bacterium]
MTQTREFNGATVEEAIERASATLGLSAEDLSYEVVDTGSDGFLGIGARDARILVEVPGTASLEEEPEPAAEEEYAEPAGTDEPAPLELSEVLGESSDAENVAVPEELLDEIRSLVTAVVEAMGFESRIDVYDAGGFVAVDVTSDNTALFIGQKGETIDALQYLVNAAIYRKHPFVKRIVLDAEGYRQRRVEAIQGIAHRTARRAIRERRSVELPPMNPSERRIVHLFLKDNPTVTTASEGSGDNRRVRISPT